MPNDAKFGLVVGVALVIAVAIVFFRKDGAGRLAVIETPATSSTANAPASSPVTQRDMRPPPPANPVSRQRPASTYEYVVHPGDTLFSIARAHYGDGERFYEIYQANRDVLKTPDALPPGLTLKLP
jgi:nucleoid-associated protein YgaU